jgi:hypothetical protein
MADHRTVFSYGPVQQLYEAAKLVLEDNNRPRGETLKRLQVAVNGLEAAAQRSDRLAHVRKAAADLYVGQDGDIDIDDACLAHPIAPDVQTSDYWVAAWVFVPSESAQEQLASLSPAQRAELEKP